MKIKISREELLKTLRLSSGLTKQSNLISETIQIDAEKDSVLIKLTNNIEGAVVTVKDKEITEEGSIIINSKKLLEVASSLDSETLTIEEIKNKYIKIDNDTSKIKLATIPNEFPTILNDIKNINFFKINTNNLIGLISLTFFSSCKDESKQNICGMLLSIKNNIINTVCTNGYMVSIAEKEIDSSYESTATIPNNSIKNILQILSKDDNTLIAIDNSKIYIKNGNTVYYSQTINKIFPQYEVIIPDKETEKFTVEIKKDDLLKALKRVMIISHVNNRPSIFEISKNQIKISSEDKEIGTIEEFLSLDYSGENFLFAVNSEYIIDSLKACDSDIIIECPKEKDKPILIIPCNNKKTKYIIMPMVM